LISKASAPGKVILFGEHFVVYGVNAILGSINKRVIVTSEITEEKFVSVSSSLGQLKIPVTQSYEELDSPLKPFFFIASEMIKKFKHNGGVKIVIDSELPSGVGLGSSSACCVAGSASISKLFTKLSREEILELAIQAEQTIFEDTSGADCTVCTYGGIIEYNIKSGFKIINSRNDFVLVIANSQIPHSTNVIVSKVRNFKENNKNEFSILCEKEAELIDNVNQALKKNDISVLGKNMSKNQEYLEEIGVSNDTLRKIITLAKKNAYGAKITGAGDGGCVIAIADKNNFEKTIRSLQSNNYECFSVKIDSKGLDTF